MSGLRTPEGQQVAEMAVALADGDRLARGRRYQRKGKVSYVLVTPGSATAEVDGSRPDPYEVTIAVRVANENVRRAVAAGDLLAAVPRANEVAVTCVCPDWGDPCKHGVAALLELAQAIDDDTGLLLRWRGIDDVVPPPPAGTESLGHRSAGEPSLVSQDGPAIERAGIDEAPVVEDLAAERLDAVRRLREQMGDRLVTPDVEGVDGHGLVSSGELEGSDVPDDPLHEFFVGAMPDDGSPVERLQEVQLDVYRTVSLMVESHDAAPVIADAIETIADHWLGR